MVKPAFSDDSINALSYAHPTDPIFFEGSLESSPILEGLLALTVLLALVPLAEVACALAFHSQGAVFSMKEAIFERAYVFSLGKLECTEAVWTIFSVLSEIGTITDRSKRTLHKSISTNEASIYEVSFISITSFGQLA